VPVVAIPLGGKTTTYCWLSSSYMAFSIQLG
jgi:hypothetical protein